GSIEPGKDADLVVTDGDPMVSATVVRYVLINGKEVG
ncbi:MAG: amidohydrolase family protein, partial [Clostridia bacterium]|nr:amidohydrolase family protein [Clostridia bacterium]